MPTDTLQKDVARSIWKILFSMHLAFTIMSVALFVSASIAGPFRRMESRINHVLDIQQTDFVRGYFEIWVPTIVAGLAIWFLLRTFDRHHYLEEFLRSFAGFITIFAPPVFWIVVYEYMTWSFEGHYFSALAEMITALICTMLILTGKWRIPLWAAFVLFSAHYAFWYVNFGGDFSRPSYLGPFGPLLGLCSAIAWFIYVNRLRKVDRVSVQPLSKD